MKQWTASSFHAFADRCESLLLKYRSLLVIGTQLSLILAAHLRGCVLLWPPVDWRVTRTSCTMWRLGMPGLIRSGMSKSIPGTIGRQKSIS